jgi:hypothetical protein
MSDLVLKRIPGAPGQFGLYFKGEILPGMVSTSLDSSANDVPTVTVTFYAAPAGEGVRVEGDDQGHDYFLSE